MFPSHDRGGGGPLKLYNGGDLVTFTADGDVLYNSANAKISGSSSSTGSFGQMIVKPDPGYQGHFNDGEALFKVSALAGTLAEFKSTSTVNAPDVLIVDGDNNDERAALHVQGNGGSTEALFVASSGKVGIGTTNPDNTGLHIHKASAGSINSNSNALLTLEDDGTNVLQFLSPTDQEQQIRFGDASDDGVGFIAYAHSTNKMSFGTNGPEKMSIDSSGNMELAGNFTPDGDNDADLGSASKRWANLFVGDLELSNFGS